MKASKPSPSFYAPDLATWRRWLEDHHASERVVWLVFHKKASRRKSVTYGDALDEALCWGWIDSLVRRIDEHTYARKFTPRTNTAKWSAINIARLKRLLAEHRVQPAGRAAVSDEILRETRRSAPQRSPGTATVSAAPELERALKANRQARSFFEALPPSHKRNYIGWVSDAKRPETRERRAREAVRLLLEGQKVLSK